MHLRSISTIIPIFGIKPAEPVKYHQYTIVSAEELKEYAEAQLGCFPSPQIAVDGLLIVDSHYEGKNDGNTCTPELSRVTLYTCLLDRTFYTNRLELDDFKRN